jgi:hypothetical protein
VSLTVTFRLFSRCFCFLRNVLTVNRLFVWFVGGEGEGGCSFLSTYVSVTWECFRRYPFEIICKRPKQPSLWCSSICENAWILSVIESLKEQCNVVYQFRVIFILVLNFALLNSTGNGSFHIFVSYTLFRLFFTFVFIRISRTCKNCLMVASLVKYNILPVQVHNTPFHCSVPCRILCCAGSLWLQWCFYHLS